MGPEQVEPQVELSWQEIAARLSEARILWLGTTDPTGAPHASPVWGAVVDDHLHFYSERTTLKARHIARDPRIVVHLESGSDVLIVHGDALDVGRPEDVPEVARQFGEKYDQPDELPYLPLADPCFDVMYRLRPTRALAWTLPDTEVSTRVWRATT